MESATTAVTAAGTAAAVTDGCILAHSCLEALIVVEILPMFGVTKHRSNAAGETLRQLSHPRHVPSQIADGLTAVRLRFSQV